MNGQMWPIRTALLIGAVGGAAYALAVNTIPFVANIDFPNPVIFGYVIGSTIGCAFVGSVLVGCVVFVRNMIVKNWGEK